MTAPTAAYCSSCGAAASGKFCAQCGAAIGAPAVGSRPAGATYPPPTQVLRGTNLLAIASLIGAFVFPPAGLVCGLIAKSQIRRTGEEGDGLATAGIIISVIAIVLWIVAFGSIMSTQHQMVHDFNNFGPGSP